MGAFDFIGDIFNAIAAPQAAAQQEQQIQNAQNLQRNIYNQDSGYYAPYYQAGTGALGQLASNLKNGAYNVNVTPQNLAQDPGYQFQLQQGMQALQRSAAANGNLGGGAFAKAMDQYSQGLASTQYQNAWNRQFQQNQFNYGALNNLANTGMQASGALGQLGTNYADAMSNLYGAYGNAQAAGTMGMWNAIGSGASNLANTAATIITGLPMGGSTPGITPSSALASNPGNYSLGTGSPQMPSMSGYNAPTIPQQGGYSLGNYNLIPPQEGGY